MKTLTESSAIDSVAKPAFRSSPPTVVFAGGGSGGHLFPGLAVAEELLRQAAGTRSVFVGSQRDVEQRVLQRYAFETHSLPMEAFSALRRRPFRTIYGIYRSFRLARKLLASIQPDVVVGLGGFASGPVVHVAAERRIPTVLLEQNFVPGRATRLLSRRADEVCTSFPGTADGLAPSLVKTFTGNPVRREIARLHAASRQARSTRTLLVLGGSQGASEVNAVVLEAVERIRDVVCGWKFVHQSGPAECDDVRRRYAELGIDAFVQPFIDTLADWYRLAEFAVSRAGGTTLAELACAGVPAVLIPHRHAIGDHQRHNAAAFVIARAARTIEPRATPADSADELAAILRDLTADRKQVERMRRAMLSVARPHAARDVAGRILAHVQSSKRQ